MAEVTNPVLGGDDDVDRGDPFVLADVDRYVLYHSGAPAVPVFESTDLVTWTPRGSALEAAAPPHWAQVDLWAPEVLRDGDRLLMYVAATQPRPAAQRDLRRRLGLARAPDALGPFAWDDEPLIPDAWTIDAHPHRDEDGTLWLFYNTRTPATRGPRGQWGSGNVVDRLLAVDRLEGRPSPVTLPDARWEANLQGTSWWNEGAWVLRRRGAWYQMYSGGFYADATYAVGGALAKGPRGPWVKDEANPTFRGTRAIVGPGHHCVVAAPDGVTPYAVYHGRVPGRRGRKVHVDRLWWVGDRPLIAGLSGGPPTRPTAGPQPAPPRPVYDPDVASWHAVLWVRADELTLAGTPLALPDAQLRRVEVACGPEGLAAWVDGVLALPSAGVGPAPPGGLGAPPGRGSPAGPAAAAGPAAGSGPPAFSARGAILARTVTSCLRDDGLVHLAEGESRAWPWGGRRALEVSLAVRGRAEIEVGPIRRSAEAAGEHARLVVLVAPDGAQEIRVTAGPGGAVVSDLLAVARDDAAAGEMAAALERVRDDRGLVRRLGRALRGG